MEPASSPLVTTSLFSNWIDQSWRKLARRNFLSFEERSLIAQTSCGSKRWIFLPRLWHLVFFAASETRCRVPVTVSSPCEQMLWRLLRNTQPSWKRLPQLQPPRVSLGKKNELPPIKGVFQCAMVLQDSLFETMSHNQWTHSIRPKVQGSWNLHSLLPEDLDFFIMLSSFAALFGNRSPNYAAGGAYQDALAHYRRTLGRKGVSVDLGIMRDIGAIAEKGSTDYLRKWELPFGTREKEFQALMKGIVAGEQRAMHRPAESCMASSIANWSRELAYEHHSTSRILDFPG